MLTIEAEPPGATGRIEELLDAAFGPGRHLKTAQRLRDGREPAPGLALVARDDRRIVGTLRFWSLRLGGGSPALLLGPVAVDPACQGRGIGSRLIRRGLGLATRGGHHRVILVGDERYYRRFGFRRGLTTGLTLPGPVDRRRFLGLELTAGALAGVRGRVRPAGAIAETAPLRRHAA